MTSTAISFETDTPPQTNKERIFAGANTVKVARVVAETTTANDNHRT
jgi:hypothetical protein